MRSTFFPHLVNGPFGDPALYVRIAFQGEALLFDCGNLAALSTRELLKVRCVFISHAHIDHLIGFDQLLRAFLYTDRHLRLFGPQGIIERIAARLDGYTWNLVEGFSLVLTVREWGPQGGREVSFRAANAFRMEPERRWNEPDELFFATPDWTVRAVPLTHGSIDSLAYALEETLHVAIHKDALGEHGYRTGPWLSRFKELLRRQIAGQTILDVPLVAGGCVPMSLDQLQERIAHCEPGMKVCYVTDAAPTEENLAEIVSLACQAHLLVIEATFAHCELQRATQRQHLTARLAGLTARQADVARLVVFHHSPRYAREPLRLADEAEQAFRGEG